MQIYVDDVSFAFCGGSTKRMFDGWILWTGKSRTIIEYIHEYKQLQFKLLINTKIDILYIYALMSAMFTKNYFDEGHCNQ